MSKIVGSKFQVKLTTLTFWMIFTVKRYLGLKQKNCPPPHNFEL